MTDRAKLVQDYIKLQKDLAQQKEKLLQMQNERDEKKKTVERTENYLKNLECIGNYVGYVLQVIDDEKIMVKAASGPRYVVGCRPKIDRSLLKPNTRIFLDMQTYTIMGILPREVDPNVHNMAAEDPGAVKF